MKTTPVLPEGYREILSVDLQKDKKLMLTVNGIALAIAVVMVAMHFIVPVSTFFASDEPFELLTKVIALCVMAVLYMILHEAIHGITMKLYGCSKVRFGLTGSYAFAATDDYISKRPYIVIALAPIVVWGIALGAACMLVPRGWFWVVYLIQIMNISGAAGDLYVICRFLRLPHDILVQDAGVSMRVYSATQV